MNIKIIYSASFREFLKNSDCRVAEILYKLFHKDYEPLMLTNKEVNYITFRNNGTISYLPGGKRAMFNDEGEWSREGRQNGRPGRIIKKLFSERVQHLFKDSDFECFSNSYKANFNDGGYKFELLENTEIPDVYQRERAPGEGTLNTSCMNDDCLDRFDIYKNCKSLKILVLLNNEELLCGRALIWKISNEMTFMDRIYVTQDFMFEKFIIHATENGWWRKKNYTSYEDKDYLVSPNGEPVRYKQMKILTPTDYDSYPYIDTFSYGYDGELNNFSGEYTYNETNGSRNGGRDEHSGQTYDEIHDEWIDENDTVYIECGSRNYRNRHTHIDYARETVSGHWYYCEDSNIVEIDGDYYETDSEDICEIDGDYHLMEDCVYSEYDEEYHLEAECVFSKSLNTYILEEDAVEIEGGEYDHKDNVVKEELPF